MDPSSPYGLGLSSGSGSHDLQPGNGPGITFVPPTPAPPADRQLPHSADITPRGSPVASEFGAHNEYPWEVDESKRYPSKDPTRLTEFERRYPPDPPGAEASDNARVWRVYRDRVNDLDSDTISGWNDAINFLLVFAGLFSAVMTAFLIDISKKLEPDYTEYSAKALAVLVARSAGANVSGALDPDPDRSHVSISTRAINGLWFVSLTIALIVSMFAILAKQWIVMFSTRMRAPVAHMRRWAQRHRAFRDGLDSWRLNAFISGLSVAMHAAVFIFLVGLVVHLYALDVILFAIVLGLTTFTLAFYITSTLAPLFYGTCPTLTPLLVHLYELYRLLARCGARPSKVHAPFDEQNVLGEGRTDDGKQDGKVVTWMVDHLPAGHDLDAVLDALGSADLKSDRGQFDNVWELIRSTARDRLQHLADYFGAGQVDGAELARVLRSCIFLEEASPAWPAGLSSTSKLGNIRTHDIPALISALELQLSQNASPKATVGATAGTVNVPTVVYQPPTPYLSPPGAEAAGGRRRLHGRISPRTGTSSAQISFTLETWKFGRQVRDEDPELRRILDVVSALARWESESPHLPSPIAAQTRRIILEKTIGAFSQESSPLRLAQCASLVSAFGHDVSTAERCHSHVTPLVQSLLKWNPTPEIPDWKLKAIQAWSHVFSRYDNLRREGLQGRLTRTQVWVIYSRLLQLCRFEERLPILNASQVAQLLEPFDADPIESSDVLARAGHGALNILVRCYPTADEEDSGSSDIFGRITFMMLQRVLDFRVTDLGLREQLVALMKRMLAGGGHHSVDMILPRGQSMTRENFAAALSKRLGDILNPRYIRHANGTVSRSVWSLVGDYLQTTGRMDSLIGFAAQLAVELSILGALQFNTLPMFNELLGHGRGASYITAPEAKGLSFVIARHARPFAQDRWNDIKDDLNRAEWPMQTDFATVEEFIDVVERSAPCSGCQLILTRVLDGIHQPQLPSRSTSLLPPVQSLYPPSSYGISPSQLESGPVSFDIHAQGSPAPVSVRLASLPMTVHVPQSEKPSHVDGVQSNVD